MENLLWKLEAVTLGENHAARLREVSLEIHEGVTAVLGASGAGKTSLLNLLVGFEKPGRGTVSSLFSPRSSTIGMFWVPQDGGLWPHLTAREHLQSVARSEGWKDGSEGELLREFDLSERASARPDELSQGERARLSVARALATGAPVLLMDEPFAHVDGARAGKYWEVVRRHVAERKGSLIFSTHSPKAVMGEAHRVICLRDGRVLYDGDVAELYWRPASREIADCLGENNWFDGDDAKIWLKDGTATNFCVRPEQLTIEVVPESPIRVESARFRGEVAEADVMNETAGVRRRFYHRPMKDTLRAGARVLLRVVSVLMFSLLTACGGSNPSPSLVAREWHAWSLPPDGAKLPAPRSVAAGRANEVIVVDNAGRVLILNEKGAVKRSWRMPESSVGRPEGVTQLSDGRIVVSDTHYHRVVIFDSDGKLLKIFGREGREKGEFIYPVGVTKDAQDNLYVCEYGGNDRVQKFDRDGNFLQAFGSFGTDPGQFQRPSGLLWHEGKVYVADAINNRIQIFSDDGKFIGVLGTPEASLSFHFPYDITLGRGGVFYVIEYGAGRISRVGLDGKLLGRFGSAGVGEGNFSTPWGIAVDSEDRVWVADFENQRVVQIKF